MFTCRFVVSAIRENDTIRYSFKSIFNLTNLLCHFNYVFFGWHFKKFVLGFSLISFVICADFSPIVLFCFIASNQFFLIDFFPFNSRFASPSFFSFIIVNN